MKTASVRLRILPALGFVLLPFLVSPAADPKTEIKTQYYVGKVLQLAKVLEKLGARLDKEAQPHWMGLVAEDGKIYPLVKDEFSRMFFSDPALLDRPMRLTARPLGGSLLQVFQVHSYLKGELHEVYYWCDICAIKRWELRACECCGAPMELREEKERR